MDYGQYKFIEYVNAVNKLDKPDNVVIYPGLTSMTASWSPVNNAEEYDITITGLDSSGNKTTKTFTNKDNTFHITGGLSPGEEYSFRLVAKIGDIVSPAYVGRFNTVVDTAINVSPGPSPSPNPQPVYNCSNCRDNDDCVSFCPSKAYCISGKCRECEPNSTITTYSGCYKDKSVCVNSSNGPHCGPCVADDACIVGYGKEYRCNIETGRCELIPPSKDGWIIGGIVGAVILIMLMVTLYIIFRKRH